MKANAKKQECKLVVNVKMPSGKKIDEKELNSFSRIYIRGFMKAKIVKKNQVEYSGPTGISLYNRMQKPMSKRDFLFVLEHVVVAAQKIRANGLKIHHLVMDLRHVYINEATKEVQFIYLPIKDYMPTTNLVVFVDSIVNSAKMENAEDVAFVAELKWHLQNMHPYTVDGIEEFIARADKSVIDSIKKQGSGHSGFMTSKQQHYYEYYDKKQEEVDDEPTGLLQENMISTPANDGWNDEATGLLSEEEDNETALLVEDSDDEGTTLLEEEDVVVAPPHYATLYRMSTQETISVDKPVFRLGKEKSYVDYFVNNNSAVSRSHADVITRIERHYIKDLNSKNRTFVNSRPIEVQVEVELFEGDRIRLGNEEFIFHK